MTTPAKEIRAAVADLRAPLLPAYLTVPVRVVQGDSESMDTLAWCDVHHPDDNDCGACETVETLHPALAHLIAVLLAAREPLAAWLESWDGVELHEDGPMRDDFQHALKVARVILGGAQ
jgi:hypothetical protein